MQSRCRSILVSIGNTGLDYAGCSWVERELLNGEAQTHVNQL